MSEKHGAWDEPHVFIREYEFYRGESMVLAEPFDMPGMTEGYDLEDAVYMASDALRIHAEDALAQHRELPGAGLGHKPRHGGQIIAIAITLSLADIPAMTAAEAARELGVSTARVAQLCREGKLESWRVGATRMVSESSVGYRKAVAAEAKRRKKPMEEEMEEEVEELLVAMG